MPISNSECPPEQYFPDPADLSDFFGGAWDFAPNGTFSDLPPNPTVPTDMNFDKSFTRPVTENSNVVAPPAQSPPMAYNSQQPSASSNSPPKGKAPNLYEALRRTRIMSMSPLMGYADPTFIPGMEWNMYPTTSPSMLAAAQLDPNQQLLLMQAARMKRPRVSPYIGFTGMDFGMGMFRRAPKMPLSPVNKPTEKPLPEQMPDNSKSMPLVLPFAAATENKLAPNRPPAKLMPAKPQLEEISLPTIEDNIEQNLRSFLRDTRDLKWENVTVVELKRILRQYELNATGKKAELMQRINKIRASYKHLEEVGGNSSKQEVEEETEKSDSSPDTMGSAPDLATTKEPNPPPLTAESLDSLFSDALDTSEMFFS